MSVTFLIKRGKRARKSEARAHIARYDARSEIAGAWCPYRGYERAEIAADQSAEVAR
jgi:hypothetical protein